MTAVGMLLMAALLFIMQFGGVSGVKLVMLILSIWLIAYGIRLLYFYSRMARHMVGGKVIMILGFILLDFGVFNFTLRNKHTLFIILYLLGFYAFKGFVDIMRAFEQKKNEASEWKWKLITGIVSVVVAIIAFVTGFFLRSEWAVVYIFAGGIVYSAIMRIVHTFKKTPVMTIL
jgi:uncharacterized membrane protein HdeD (DUF308 family)